MFLFRTSIGSMFWLMAWFRLIILLLPSSSSSTTLLLIQAKTSRRHKDPFYGTPFANHPKYRHYQKQHKAFDNGDHVFAAQTIRNIHRQAAAAATRGNRHGTDSSSSSSSSSSNHTSEHQQDGGRHRHLRRKNAAENDPFCATVPQDPLARCDRLVGCYQDMSIVDLVVYFFDDDIDPDTGDVDEDLTPTNRNDAVRIEDKIKDINDLVDAVRRALSPTAKQARCDLLLREFHRNEEKLGGPLGTTYIWEAGTVSDVCRARGTQRPVSFVDIKTNDKIGGNPDCISDAIFTQLYLCSRDLYQLRPLLYQRDGFAFGTTSFNDRIDIPIGVRSEGVDMHGYPKTTNVQRNLCGDDCLYSYTDNNPGGGQCGSNSILDKYYDPNAVDADAALALLFGEEASVGLVCAFAKEARDRQREGGSPFVFPGYCCMDKPAQSDIWGTLYSCDQRCENYAPYFAGFSEEACTVWSGTFCRFPRSCQALVDQLLALKDGAQTQDRKLYFEYLDQAPEVEDTDSALKCGKLREYLGFDEDYPDDQDIIDELERLRCVPDFEDFFVIGSGGPSRPTEEACALGLIEPGSPSVSAETGLAWRSAHFALREVVATLEAAYEVVAGFECSTLCSDFTASNAVCVPIKNAVAIAFASAMFSVKLALSVSELTYSIQATLTNFNFNEMYNHAMVMYSNQEKIFCEITSVLEGFAEAVETVTQELTDSIKMVSLRIVNDIEVESQTIQNALQVLNLEVTNLITAVTTLVLNTISESETSISNQIALSKQAVSTSIENTETTITELVDESTQDIRDDLEAARSDIVDLLNATLVATNRFAGCNGRDEDYDQIADNCEEDLFPPEVVLRFSSETMNAGDDNVVTVSGLTFSSDEEAIAYIRDVVSVVDDCAPAEALVLEVELQNEAANACGPKMFTATAVHPTECGMKIGSSLVFALDVDEVIPTIMCGFDGSSFSNRDLLVIEESNDGPENTNFFYRVASTCSNVKVEIQILSNEWEMEEMSFVTFNSPDASLLVTPYLCDASSKSRGSSDGLCEDDDTTELRIYEVQATATSDSGLSSTTTCNVAIIPKKSRVLKGVMSMSAKSDSSMSMGSSGGKMGGKGSGISYSEADLRQLIVNSLQRFRINQLGFALSP